jgi:hypothetical protein
MNLTIDELNLSYPVKYIASIMMKKGGVCTEIKGTKLYKITYRHKEYIFSYDMNPLIPYMYGIIFSSLYFWRQILAYLKIPFTYMKPSRTQILSVLVTRDGFYNALLEHNVFLTGDGKTSTGNLIAKENMIRINSSGKTIFPISGSHTRTVLNRIVPKGQLLRVAKTVDYEEITQTIDYSYIEVCQNILTMLPGLPYLCVSLYAKNSTVKQSCIVGKFDLSGGMNIFHPIIKGKKQCATGEKIVSLLL